ESFLDRVGHHLVEHPDDVADALSGEPASDEAPAELVHTGNVDFPEREPAASWHEMTLDAALVVQPGRGMQVSIPGDGAAAAKGRGEPVPGQDVILEGHEPVGQGLRLEELKAEPRGKKAWYSKSPSRIAASTSRMVCRQRRRFSAVAGSPVYSLQRTPCQMKSKKRLPDFSRTGM